MRKRRCLSPKNRRILKSILKIEELECRALLTSAPITAFGINGDSLSDEYLHQTYDYARNWNELLNDLQGVNFGPTGAYDEPRRIGGFEYNWARYGADSNTLLLSNQHTELAAQINAGLVSHAILAIGQNDFAPWTDAYIGIASGTWTPEMIQSYSDQVVDNITIALTTLYNTNVHLIFSNIVDYGIAPVTINAYDVSQRDLASSAIEAVNQRLAILADTLNVPLIDLNGVARHFFGTNSNPTDFWSVGGVLISNTAGVDPTNAFVDDGIHPHSIVQAQMANTFLSAFNKAYGTPINLITEQEAVEAAGLIYMSDTLSYDVSSFINLPNNSAPLISGVGGVAIPYTKNTSPVVLANAAVVYDDDDLNYAVGALTVSVTTNADTDDRLSIANVGNGDGGIGVFGNKVTYSGTVIGTFSGGDGLTPLEILLNEQPDTEVVQALIRQITFHTVGDAPSSPLRTISFKLADGDGGVSTVSQDVLINLNNHAPVLNASASPTLGSLLEGAIDPSGMTVAAMVVDGSITDQDGTAIEAIAITEVNSSLGTWQYRLDGGAAWLTIASDLINNQTNELALLLGPTAQLRLLPFADLNGSLDDGITFRAWDMSSGTQGEYAVLTGIGGGTAFSSASDTVAIAVTALNDAPTFNAGDGKVLTNIDPPAFSSSLDTGFSVALQPDGKIVLAGSSSLGDISDFGLVRYNADGSLDPSFGQGGKVTTDFDGGSDYGYSVVVQSDGRIVVGGDSRQGNSVAFAMVRYQRDGSLDTSFGSGGRVITQFEANSTGFSLALQADGKILLAGYSAGSDGAQFAIARYNIDGTLDGDFGNGGTVTTGIGTGQSFGFAIAIQPDGKIIVSGSAYNGTDEDFAIVRYNADGSLDDGFGTGGKLLANFGGFDDGQAVFVQPDGKILIAGTAMNGDSNDFAILRYNLDGSLDDGFGNGGIVKTDFNADDDHPYSMVVQGDGKILVSGWSDAGESSRFALARYDSDGTLDIEFGDSGKVTTSIGKYDSGWSIALQPDGRIVVGGDSYESYDGLFALLRYNVDGSLDNTFGVPANSLGGVVSYSASIGPVVLDSDVRVFDAELFAANNFQGATLTLVRSGGASDQDLFSATGTIDTLAEDADLVVDGITIGTVTTNSGGILVLTFNGSATSALVNSAMQQIAYANASDAPSNSVQIDWIFNDKNSGSQGIGGALIATGSVTVTFTFAPYQNPRDKFDVDDDNSLSPLDVLAIINLLNSRGSSLPVDGLPGPPDFVDVNGDNRVDPLDVLEVINRINSRGSGEGEGEGNHGNELFGLGSMDASRTMNSWIDPCGLEIAKRQSQHKMGSVETSTLSWNTYVTNQGSQAKTYDGFGPIQDNYDTGDDDWNWFSEEGWTDLDLVDRVLAEISEGI